jgi:hypothetical protein
MGTASRAQSFRSLLSGPATACLSLSSLPPWAAASPAKRPHHLPISSLGPAQLLTPARIASPLLSHLHRGLPCQHRRLPLGE